MLTLLSTGDMRVTRAADERATQLRVSDALPFDGADAVRVTRTGEVMALVRVTAKTVFVVRGEENTAPAPVLVGDTLEAIVGWTA